MSRVITVADCIVSSCIASHVYRLHTSCKRPYKRAQRLKGGRDGFFSHEQLLDRLLRNEELDRDSAEDELRWMQQAVQSSGPGAQKKSLNEMVELRSAGMPLQYILGLHQLICRHSMADVRIQATQNLAHYNCSAVLRL